MVLVLFRGRKRAASKALCSHLKTASAICSRSSVRKCQEVWRMDGKSFLIGLFEAPCELRAGILANLLPTA